MSKSLVVEIDSLDQPAVGTVLAVVDYYEEYKCIREEHGTGKDLIRLWANIPGEGAVVGQRVSLGVTSGAEGAVADAKDSLGDRMKLLETVPRSRLVPKTPVIIRLDGKAFHTFTRQMTRPYDRAFHECMWETAKYLGENVIGCKLAYVQSDEISLLLVDFGSKNMQPWFDDEVQKMVSISAAMATAAFIRAYAKRFPERWATSLESGKGLPAFDSRCWNVPMDEVTNVFIWRQQDASRNSVSMLAQAHFSHKRLHGVSMSGMQDLLMLEKGINWNDCPVPQKRGVCLVREVYEAPVPEERRKPGQPITVTRSRWVVDENIPIFTSPDGREYVERFLRVPSEGT